MRSAARYRRSNKAFAHACLLTCLITVSGCPFVLPTPGVQSHAPSPEAVLRIEPGVTTRIDVLMTLGEPDRRVEEDRYFVYEWSETHAVVGVIVGGGYQAGVLGTAELGDRNALALEFGPDARVTRVKTFSMSMQGGQGRGRRAGHDGTASAEGRRRVDERGR